MEWLPFSALQTKRKLAIEFYDDAISSAMPLGAEAVRQTKALIGRSDAWLLGTALLRRPDLDVDWVFERCREVQAAPDSMLDLWARGHFKSTIVTFVMSIMEIIRDPEITIGIFSCTRPIAKGFLSQIKREMEDNELLKYVFRDVLWADPHKDSPRWSEDSGLIVKRKSNPKEATIEAHGLTDGQPTSRHFGLLVYDDVVTRESITTAEQRQKVLEAWELSQNLGVPGGRVRTLGTRYSLGDLYDVMISRKAVVPRLYPATDNGRLDGRPVLLSEEDWAEKLRNSSRATLAAQMLQNPLADSDAVFSTLWCRPYELRPRTMAVGIVVDPSRGKSASSDDTAIAVVGISSTGNYHLLDGCSHRMSLSQRWTHLKGYYRRWSAMKGVQSIQVGYEVVGAQSDVEYFEEQMRIDIKKDIPDAFFPISELNWSRDGARSKVDRVSRLEPLFRSGRFFLSSMVLHDGKPCFWRVDRDSDSKTYGQIEYWPVTGLTKMQLEAAKGGSSDLIAKLLTVRDPGSPSPREGGGRYDLTAKMISQYQEFPYGRKDDLIDAVSRIIDLDIRPPMAPSDRVSRDPRLFTDGV